MEAMNNSNRNATSDYRDRAVRGNPRRRETVAPMPPVSVIDAAAVLFESRRGEHVKLGEEMLKIDGGNIYPSDLWAMAALNRSIANIRGFESLVRDRNLLCAAVFIRMQLDTALRFTAFAHVPSERDTLIKVLEGTSLRKLQDMHGKRLTDARIKDRFLELNPGPEFAWINDVYDKTSGYVHLSDAHLMAINYGAENSSPGSAIRLVVGSPAKPPDDSTLNNVIGTFDKATHLVLVCVGSWVMHKKSRRDPGTSEEQGDPSESRVG